MREGNSDLSLKKLQPGNKGRLLADFCGSSAAGIALERLVSKGRQCPGILPMWLSSVAFPICLVQPCLA